MTSLLQKRPSLHETWGGSFGWFNPYYFKGSPIPDRSGWIKNMSSVDIPAEILNILALGHKHGVQFDKNEFPVQDFRPLMKRTENLLEGKW